MARCSAAREFKVAAYMPAFMMDHDFCKSRLSSSILPSWPAARTLTTRAGALDALSSGRRLWTKRMRE